MGIPLVFDGPQAAASLAEQLDAVTGAVELLVAALIAYLEATRARDIGARLDEMERALERPEGDAERLTRGG
jgi:hypothetical protein